MKDEFWLPYVIISPKGVYYIGMHKSEADCWNIALGWPDDSEIEWCKNNGWYCISATLSWKDPTNKSAIGAQGKFVYN